MAQDADIAAWMAAGVITPAQAERMQADLSARRKDRASDEFVIVLSTIGAILLGIGAILFVAANWQGMSNLTKTLVLSGATFGVSALGYLLAYEAKTLPKVGAALLFLGTLLFGATLFLLGQMYHVEANSHLLVLTWLVGVLPLVYILQSRSIAGLCTVLLFIWFGLFVFRGMTPNGRDSLAFPVLYLLAGLWVFEAGGLHYFSEQLRGVARIYRLGAIDVALFSLFVLTFRFVSGKDGWWGTELSQPYSKQVVAGVFLIGATAAALAFVNGLKNPSSSDTNDLEVRTSLGLVLLALTYFGVPAHSTNVYPIVFNLALMGCILALIMVGYRREDLRLVNIGLSAFAMLVLVRYCDFFWDLLPRSLFFMVGGAILVLGGTALERKRRQIKAQFVAK